MHEYDVTLKSILTRLAGSVLAELTGFAVERWHNVELPAVRHRRADLIGETSTGNLVHIELQSTNQTNMALRMLEYSLAIRRKFHRFPGQVVLYVGNAPLRMKNRLDAPGLSFEYSLVDIRDTDSEALLASGSLENNIIAVLTGFGAERAAVQRILGRIAASRADERGTALGELMILAGLRKLGTVIEREIEQMPILDDIMDHEVLGRERKRGIALGRAEGLAEGLAEGVTEGERKVVLRLIGKRFGLVPDWVRERVNALCASDLEQIELRLLDASSLQDLIR
jgi:predicted transposase YdaD